MLPVHWYTSKLIFLELSIPETLPVRDIYLFKKGQEQTNALQVIEFQL